MGSMRPRWAQGPEWDGWKTAGAWKDIESVVMESRGWTIHIDEDGALYATRRDGGRLHSDGTLCFASPQAALGVAQAIFGAEAPDGR